MIVSIVVLFLFFGLLIYESGTKEEEINIDEQKRKQLDEFRYL